MSDYICFEIQVEIMKRLPVKSLLRFRSVSKSWKSLIDSSQFVNTYNVPETDRPHLFVCHTHGKISFMDEETFTQQDFTPTISVHTELLLQRARIVGSSHGVFCLYNCGMEIAALWNPSIRKLVGVSVPSCEEIVGQSENHFILGFGVCPVTIDPTIVKITQFKMQWESEMQRWTHDPWVVEVFTLSSGKWITIPSTKLVVKNSIRVTWSQVVIDRFIYWFGFDYEKFENGLPVRHHLIISFDMTTREFRVINLPKSSEQTMYRECSICKVSESLSVHVFEYDRNVSQYTRVVWRMDDDDDGVSSSFTKLFTIDMPYLWRVEGFTKIGSKLLITVPHEKERALAVYDPCSRHINKICIVANDSPLFYVGFYSYKKTLVMIDQLDNIIYAEAGVSVFSDYRTDGQSALPVENRSAPNSLPRTGRFHRFFNFSLLRKLCNIR